MRLTNEFKTGLVVIAAIGVGAFFLARTANFSSKPYLLKTYFTFADGIKQDSIVKLSGIEVGRVEKIRFDYQPKTMVELVLALSRDAKVRGAPLRRLLWRRVRRSQARIPLRCEN